MVGWSVAWSGQPSEQADHDRLHANGLLFSAVATHRVALSSATHHVYLFLSLSLSLPLSMYIYIYIGYIYIYTFFSPSLYVYDLRPVAASSAV